MRLVFRTLAILLVVVGSAIAEPIDLRVVKINDKGIVEVTKTISQPQEYTYQVQIPVQVQVIQNGQPVVQVQTVTETRVGTRMTQTTAFAPLDDKTTIFTDLQGKAIPVADLKKPLEKGPIAVIFVPKEGVLPSAAILQAFKSDTLIMRGEADIPARKGIGTLVPRRAFEGKVEEMKKAEEPRKVDDKK